MDKKEYICKKENPREKLYETQNQITDYLYYHYCNSSFFDGYRFFVHRNLSDEY